MGKVFTFDEIKQGCVPSIDSFANFNDEFEKTIILEPAFLGAVVYGSIKNNTHSIRSDFDALVVYRKEEEKRALKCISNLHELAQKLCIPLNIQCIDTKLAKTAHHRFYKLYLDHVSMIVEREGFIKENPLIHITPATTDKNADAKNYIGTKIASLINMHVLGNTRTKEQTALFLQKMLEAPIHAARKVLHCRGKLPWPDDKTSVLESYQEVFGDLSKVGMLLRDLIKIDNAYTVKFQGQLDNPIQDTYEEMLLKIGRSAFPRTISFLRTCMRQMQELDEG